MKSLQEIAIEKGKELLIEELEIHVNPESIKEFEKPQLYEDANGKKFFGLALIEGMPISDFKKNKNGRAYPLLEWKKALIEKSKTYCLADHPSDSGSTTKISGIWLNPRINEQKQIVEADLVVADNDHGKTMLFCAKNGLLEVSTSSFGNLTEEGTVYDLEVERYGDHVINRSNPSAIINKDVKIYENSDDKGELIEQKNTNYVEEEKVSSDDSKVNIQESHNEVNMENLKNYDKAARNQIREQMDSAVNGNKFDEAIVKLNRLEIPEDMIQEKEHAVASLQAKLTEKLAVDSKEISELKENVKELTDENEKLQTVITESKETIDKMNEMFQLPEGFESQEELYENYGKMAEDLSKVATLFENETLKEREIESLEDIVLLAESAEVMDKKIGELVQVIKQIQESKVSAESLKTELEEGLAVAYDRIKVYEELLEGTYDYKFTEEDEEDDGEKKDNKDGTKEDDKDGKKDEKEKKDEDYKFEGRKPFFEESYGIIADKDIQSVESRQKFDESKSEKELIRKLYEAHVKVKPQLSMMKEAILSLDTVEEAGKLIGAFEATKDANDGVQLKESTSTGMTKQEILDKAYGKL